MMNRPPAFHEDMSRDQGVGTSSNRSFGFVFAALFLILGVWPLMEGDGVRLWSLGISLVFVGLAMAAPKQLAPFNRLWLRFGRLLHHVMSPLVLGVLFFAVITPFGWAMRLLGKQTLKLELEADTKSYWIERRPPGPSPETMRNQF